MLRPVFLHENRRLDRELDGRPQQIEIGEMHDLAVDVAAPIAVNHPVEKQSGDEEDY